MNPYLALTRPGNMILTAIAVIAGSFIAAGPEIMDFQIEVAICCLCSMMLVGGGNALNDYNDRETDKENHPRRPIPSSRISAVNDPGPTLWMFGLAVLATITREIIKDIQDLEGDRDRRTLPASIGIENSMRVAILFLLIAIGLSYTAMDQFDGMASNAYLGGITLANGTMLFGIYNAKQEDYFAGQKNLKQGMGIAMLAFIAAAGLS